MEDLMHPDHRSGMWEQGPLVCIVNILFIIPSTTSFICSSSDNVSPVSPGVKNPHRKQYFWSEF